MTFPSTRIPKLLAISWHCVCGDFGLLRFPHTQGSPIVEEATRALRKHHPHPEVQFGNVSAKLNPDAFSLEKP